MSVAILQGAVEQGLLWSLMTLGVYLTYRILDYADLTVEGSFPLGAAVAAKLITEGYSPLIATIYALFAGVLAGLLTGFLHTKLKIAPLLSGILSMIALYSINLRIMEKANLPLLRSDTIITKSIELGLSPKYAVLFIGLIVSMLVVLLLWAFLKTELGLCIRATGNNPQMIRSLGMNTDFTKILGLCLSNSLVAMSGALIAQHQKFADISMGVGTIVIGLASVIIGEVLFGSNSLPRALVAVILGSIVYRIVIAAVLELGFNPNDLRLFSSLIVIIALSLPVIRENLNIKFKQLGKG